jgi:Bacterial DNA-binding protein
VLKSELIQRLSAQNPHLRQDDVEKILNAMLDAITAAMARGDRVELRGFGAGIGSQRLNCDDILHCGAATFARWPVVPVHPL